MSYIGGKEAEEFVISRIRMYVGNEGELLPPLEQERILDRVARGYEHVLADRQKSAYRRYHGHSEYTACTPDNCLVRKAYAGAHNHKYGEFCNSGCKEWK